MIGRQKSTERNKSGEGNKKVSEEGKKAAQEKRKQENEIEGAM